MRPHLPVCGEFRESIIIWRYKSNQDYFNNTIFWVNRVDPDISSLK